MKEINPKGPMFTLIIARFITGQGSGAGSPVNPLRDGLHLDSLQQLHKGFPISFEDAWAGLV